VNIVRRAQYFGDSSEIQKFSDDSFSDCHEKENSNGKSGRFDDRSTRNEDSRGGSPADRGDFLDANGATDVAGDAAIAKGTASRHLRSQRDVQICQLQERLREISTKPSSVANIRVTDPFVSVPVALVPLRVEILLQILLSMTNRTALPRYRRRRCQPF